MPKGELNDLQAMVKADPGFTGRAELHDFYVAANLEKWKTRKKLVGNGQCPVLPQYASGAPLVRTWLKGPLVKGNKAVPAGTVIAAGWNGDGKYPSNRHGNHAAIYLGQTSKGLQVLDQWTGKDVTTRGFERTLPFGIRRGDDIVDGGDYFYVVLSARFLTEWDWGMAYVGEAIAATAGF